MSIERYSTVRDETTALIFDDVFLALEKRKTLSANDSFSLKIISPSNLAVLFLSKCNLFWT